jgi:hypothetical protein
MINHGLGILPQPPAQTCCSAPMTLFMQIGASQTAIWFTVSNGSSGFGGLVVPKIAGLNPAETVEFFQAKKSPVCLLSEGK